MHIKVNKYIFKRKENEKLELYYIRWEPTSFLCNILNGVSGTVAFDKYFK